MKLPWWTARSWERVGPHCVMTAVGTAILNRASPITCSLLNPRKSPLKLTTNALPCVAWVGSPVVASTTGAVGLEVVALVVLPLPPSDVVGVVGLVAVLLVSGLGPPGPVLAPVTRVVRGWVDGTYPGQPNPSAPVLESAGFEGQQPKPSLTWVPQQPSTVSSQPSGPGVSRTMSMQVSAPVSSWTKSQP